MFNVLVKIKQNQKLITKSTNKKYKKGQTIIEMFQKMRK